MRRSRNPRSQLVLTRKGRLLRTVLALFALLLFILAVVVLMQIVGSGEEGAAPPSSSESGPEALTAPASPMAGEASAMEPTSEKSSAAQPSSSDPVSAEPSSPDPTAELTERHDGIVQSQTVGDGTWTVAEPSTETEQTAGPVHTYALRVEDGTDLDAAETAAEVAAVLADPRGWQATDEVSFQQVTDPEQADFTISIASPPTVDELCAPARTGGVWSCRIGQDVALNSDRWLYLTPTYDDPAEYRAYLVNHEVGHYLGHQHATCDGDGLAAPVMLQQSIDLGGCRPNAWPAQDGQG